MDPVSYWPMAREYSVWNTAIASLQFWTVDLKAHILSSAIEQVYNAFFYSTSTYMLCQQSDEVLFGCFLTTLNAAFESKLAFEDKGYSSSNKNFNIPTPLRRTSKIHHVSSKEHASFDPNPVMPHTRGIRELPCRLVHRHLSVLLRKMMMTPPWMRLHLHTVHHQHNITQVPSSNHLPNALCICMLPVIIKRNE